MLNSAKSTECQPDATIPTQVPDATPISAAGNQPPVQAVNWSEQAGMVMVDGRFWGVECGAGAVAAMKPGAQVLVVGGDGIAIATLDATPGELWRGQRAFWVRHTPGGTPMIADVVGPVRQMG